MRACSCVLSLGGMRSEEPQASLKHHCVGRTGKALAACLMAVHPWAGLASLPSQGSFHILPHTPREHRN